MELDRQAVVRAVDEGRADARHLVDALRRQCHHPDDQVIETTSLPRSPRDLGATYRLCLLCGRHETMRQGRFTHLQSDAVPVNSETYHLAAKHVLSELGLDDITHGTL